LRKIKVVVVPTGIRTSVTAVKGQISKYLPGLGAAHGPDKDLKTMQGLGEGFKRL
jgi:hypothetical protein